jgi:hypothetical protein
MVRKMETNSNAEKRQGRHLKRINNLHRLYATQLGKAYIRLAVHASKHGVWRKFELDFTNQKCIQVGAVTKEDEAKKWVNDIGQVPLGDDEL